jgi:hypothetical protein
VTSKRAGNKLRLEWSISGSKASAQVVAVSVFVNRQGTFNRLYLTHNNQIIELIEPEVEVDASSS